MNGFSVIMPTYNQASFIRRAINSICAQTYTKWELIIVNDGSTDNTEEYISDFLSSGLPIRYLKNENNKGLGAAINQALDLSSYKYISYLPSDDYYDYNHLACMKKKFDSSDDIVLVYSGVRYDNSDSATYTNCQETYDTRKNYFLSLVQVAHKKTDDKWIERDEYVSEDLFFSFWRKLTDKGIFISTQEITCEWTNHPDQRHKITGEKFGGGLNKYRYYYNVKTPIKIRHTSYKTTDENKIYASYRKKNALSRDGLKIVLVGDLAYNPERVYALEEAGHKLFGLWSKPAFGYSTVGPLPFGNVEDIPYESWKEYVRNIRPDIFYAQISTGAILIAYEIMEAKTGIPIVWHFKESPHEAMKRGLWDKLIHLFSNADGVVYLNIEAKLYYEQFIKRRGPECILDPELPKDCFSGINLSEKLSDKGKGIHTVVVGRMIGLSPIDVKMLAMNNIHIHLYSQNYTHELQFIKPYKIVAPGHFHVHTYCSQLNWVEEFSKYDAGWLHCFESKNNNFLMKASWADLNIPARINTLVAAGLPIIQKDNFNNIVAMRNYVKNYDMGIFYYNMDDLIKKLRDKDEMKRLSNRVILNRQYFTIDYHLSFLGDFFRKVMNYNLNKGQN